MVLAHFQLTLNALPRSVLCLVQITEYDFLRVHASSEDAVISRDLAKVLIDAFPGRDAETAFAEIFGDASPGWDVREGTGAAIVIETGPNGADLAALIRAIGLAAPEALEHEMHYIPKPPGPVAGHPTNAQTKKGRGRAAIALSMEPRMNCDIDYRYRRALSPEGLVTYETCLMAVNDAVADAKLAGLDPAADPAVQLLSRRLARFSLGTAENEHDDDQDLRKRCVESLAALKHKPAIVALVLRGVDHRPVELAHYRREGQRTLRQIAGELGLERDRYRLGYLAPTANMAGDHTLESRDIFVRISPERWGEQGVAWRHPQWKTPGNALRKAPITVLRDIPAFAQRLARELKPPAARQASLI